MTSGLSELALFVQQNPEAVSATAQYLNGMTDDLIKDLIGLAGGDQVKIWRLEKNARNIHAAKKRLEADGIVPQPVSPSIGVPLLEASSLEEREELLDLWVALLAAAMDPRRANKVRQSFIETVKSMDPTDALVIREIRLARRNPNGPLNLTTETAGEIGRTPDEVEVSFLNLLRLGCVFVPGSQQLAVISMSEAALTAKGRELKKILGLPG